MNELKSASLVACVARAARASSLEAARGLACLGVLLAVALAAAGPAGAQDGTLSARDREARSLFEAGRTAFEDGRFEDARSYFERAHELSGRAELLYNIGSAEDRLRHDEAAIEAFEGYLAALPDAANRTEVEARIAALRAAVAERAALENAAASGGEIEAAPPSEPVHGGGPTLVWTWVAGAAALAFGGVAIGTWVAANDAYGALERGCLAGGGCSDGEIAASDVEELVLTTNVFFVSALLATGLSGLALGIELASAPGAEGAGASARLRLGPASVAVEGIF